MANWCKNFLRVTGPDRDMARFQKLAAAVAPRPKTATAPPPEPFSFRRPVPLPATPQTTTTKTGLGSPQHEWGCRGDACRSELVETWDGGRLYRFATPWNPPMEFLRQVSARWPTLVLILDYDEHMMAFRGVACAQAGKLQHSHLDL